MRDCLLEPIPEIFEAAALLKAGLHFHLKGQHPDARSCFRSANMNVVRNWTEALWGKKNPDIHFKVDLSQKGHPILNKIDRVPLRMPNSAEKKAIIERDGYNCRFYTIPVISPEIRKILATLYPEDIQWGRKNTEQHAAFQCMWLQFDHVLPHSRGGNNDLDNILITCAPCNFGRMDNMLSEMKLNDPRDNEFKKSYWCGLESLVE